MRSRPLQGYTPWCAASSESIELSVENSLPRTEVCDEGVDFKAWLPTRPFEAPVVSSDSSPTYGVWYLSPGLPVEMFERVI